MADVHERSKRILNTLLTQIDNVSTEVKTWAEKELAILNAETSTPTARADKPAK